MRDKNPFYLMLVVKTWFHQEREKIWIKNKLKKTVSFSPIYFSDITNISMCCTLLLCFLHGINLSCESGLHGARCCREEKEVLFHPWKSSCQEAVYLAAPTAELFVKSFCYSRVMSLRELLCILGQTWPDVMSPTCFFMNRGHDI